MSEEHPMPSEKRWQNAHEEQQHLVRALERTEAERMRLEHERLYLQAKIQSVGQQEQAIHNEQHLARERLHHLQREISEMEADIAFQNARVQEAEEGRRHTRTVYDPLPSIVDGYLTDAKACPVCGMPPDRLRWTHHVSTHSSPNGEIMISGWSTDCPQCGRAVETISESVG